MRARFVLRGSGGTLACTRLLNDDGTSRGEFGGPRELSLDLGGEVRAPGFAQDLPRVPFQLPRRTAPAASVGCFASARRPSPLCKRVGVHNFTFAVCSGFTRVTVRESARPPKW